MRSVFFLRNGEPRGLTAIPAQVSTSPAKRRFVVIATSLGYACAAWRYAAKVALHALGAYPRVTATYVCVAAGVSYLSTNYVRSTAVFFDAIKATCRVGALFFAFHTTRSVAASSCIVLAFLYANAFGETTLPWRDVLATAVNVLSGAYDADRSALAQAKSRATDVPRDATNYLHGHKFLTQDEYEAQAKRTTDAAMLALAQSPGYAAWLAKNHGRISLAGRRPSSDDADDDDL